MKRDRQQDMMKLAQAFYDHIGGDKYSYGIGLDGKRPFGNSDVSGDVLRIIGWEPSLSAASADRDEELDEAADYADSLYDDLRRFLAECWADYVAMRAALKDGGESR